MNNNINVDIKDLGALDKKYNKDQKHACLRHSLSKTKLNDAVFSLDQAEGTDFVFSIDNKTMPVTNQKQSGRCWIFSACNVLREKIAKDLGITEMFEISQNFIAFYDKLEKINFVMEACIDRVEEEPDERKLMFILNNAVGDGGQWDMFVNLVNKYGICPKAYMVETCQSSYTMDMNRLINSTLRNFACQAHKMFLNKQSVEEIRTLKESYLDRFYALLCDCFGTPCQKFDFEYRDAKGEYHLEKGMTPISFKDKYLGEFLSSYVSIINAPTQDKPYNTTYTVEYLGNVIEGKKVTHLNITMERMKELIINQLKDGNLVWFGSDVSRYKVREEGTGLWDDKHFDYQNPFNLDVSFEKEDMLNYFDSCMNHAMVLTGVDIKNGKPTRWKVENSWGGDIGNKGYFVMSDSFFDKFVYQAAILDQYLNEEEKEALKKEPVLLAPWDPFGTLAD